ncbi:MAG: DNA primase [Microbacteriaceae bacterium]
MAGLIRRGDIDEVRSRTNIADIIGDHVTLKNAGVGSMKGLCPFHEERSPSFHVRPQVGFYHCFGCGEGGDVFTFLQKVDHVSFQEAVERLAARIGFQLHYEDGGEAVADHGNRARLLAANKAAEDYFRTQLTSPEAAEARKFLGQRGFDPAAAERFGVGFAPKSFDALSKALKAQGFTENELVTAGLLSTGDRGNSYDRFRGRLTWPIRDVTGQTVGFGARRLFDDDKGPKYLNTPETPVYHKSQVLYGLDLAKRDIAKGKQVVVVEGYTDVMACHLAGVTTAVATCGTAFGVDHIKVVRRVLGDVANVDTTGTGEVIFTFDPDEAGQKAASRAFTEEQRFAAQTFVAVAPDGLDPCDLRLNRGDDAVRRLVQTRKPMFEFMIRRELTEHDLETVEGRVAALRAAAPVIAGIRDQSLSVGYVRSVAGWIGIDPADVSRAVASARKSLPARGAAEPRGDSRSGPEARGAEGSNATGPRPSLGPVAPAEQYLAEPAVVEAPPVSIMTLPTDPSTRLERDAMMAILQQPAAIGRDLVERASRVGFHNQPLAMVRDAVAANLDHLEAPNWLTVIVQAVPGPVARLTEELAVAPIPERPGQLAAYCRGITTSLVDRDLARRKADLLGGLQRTDAAADPERYTQLQRDLVQVEHDRRALREE